MVLADLWDDEDELTVVRAPLGVRHQSGVIPVVDDRSDAIVEEAPPSTVRTEQMSDETSHVRPTAPVAAEASTDDDDEHEPIGASSFKTGTIVMDVPPTPAEMFGKRTLQVTREELFANSAPVAWQEECEPAEEAPPMPAPAFPTPVEAFVDEVSQGGLPPLPIPEVVEPAIGELGLRQSSLVPVPVDDASMAPSSRQHRRRDVLRRARVAATICILACVGAMVGGAVWLGWL